MAAYFTDQVISPISARQRKRLLYAIVLSLALHFALLMSLPGGPAGRSGPVVTSFNARIEPLAQSTPPVAKEIPVPQPAPVAQAIPVPAETKPQPVKLAPPLKPSVPPSAGAESAVAADATYYPAKQLDVYPKPLAPIKLRYPEMPSDAPVEGGVLLLLLIDEFGVVNDVSVVESDPPGYFEDVAQREYRAIAFSPGMRGDRAVKSRVLIHVRYTNSAGKSSASTTVE